MPTPEELEQFRLELIQKQLDQHKQRKKRRSSLSEESASEFKEYIDKAIETGTNVTIPYRSFIHYTPLTMHRKISDAILYYGTHGSTDVETRNRYINLRRQVVVNMSDNAAEGIIIRFKEAQRKLRIHGEVQTEDTMVWKTRLLEAAEAGFPEPINMTNLMLTAADVQWIEEFINNANAGRPQQLVSLVNLSMIRIIP